MIKYEYQCKSCEDHFETKQSIKDKPLKFCYKCGKEDLERVIFPTMGFTRKEATTVGQVMDRNSKRLGQNEIQERTLKDQEKKKKPMQEAKLELYKKLGKASESQKQKYITEGKI